MTGAPLFLIKPAQAQIEGVAYEPFPADDEPKYTTHPAFRYDKGLCLALESRHLTVLAMFLKMKWDDPEATMEGKLTTGRAWLAGEIPIPDIQWESIKKSRTKWLKADSHPLDSPIGFLHPDFPSNN